MTLALIALAAITLATVDAIRSDIRKRRIARDLADAYDAGYNEGWDAFGRHYNATDARFAG